MYRLLIVESDRNQCEKIKGLIDWSAYNFSALITAQTYGDAVTKALDFNPHVALIDIRLCNQWGYELAEQLRSAGLRTVFAMIADSDNSYLMRRSMQATAQDYLLKPLDPGELGAFVERVVVNDLHGTLRSAGGDHREMDPVLRVEYSQLSKITNKIIMVVKSDYRQPQTLAAIAQALDMSGKYIGRVFLKDTGIKFSEYLMAYRMLEAQRLIVNTKEKISSIANMVGYAQLNNFYSHFRSYFGVSPSSLRNHGTLPEAKTAVCPDGDGK